MIQSACRLDVRTIVCVLGDVVRFASSMVQPRAQLVAENLFLRKQLALYVERKIQPRRSLPDGVCRTPPVRGKGSAHLSHNWLQLVTRPFFSPACGHGPF